MQKILEELFSLELSGYYTDLTRDPKYKEMTDEAMELKEMVSKKIHPDDEDLFLTMLSRYSNASYRDAVQAYIDGTRLGASLMLEILLPLLSH